MLASFCIWHALIWQVFYRIHIDNCWKKLNETGHAYMKKKSNQYEVKTNFQSNVNYNIRELSAVQEFRMCGVLEFVTINKNLKSWIKLMNSSRHCALYISTYIWDELLLYQSKSSIIIFLHLSLHLWWVKLSNGQPRSDIHFLKIVIF